MIDTEALKSKVLASAMQGCLTNHLPEDDDIDELYETIIGTKAGLVKEGKIRKDKKYEEIKAENIPYQIPPYWKWVRFGKIINLQSGQDLKPEEYNANNTGIPYITGASNYTDNGSFIINRWTENPKAFAAAGDILLSCKGTVGKLSILQIPEVHIARQIMGIRTYCISNAFVFYFMQSVIYGIKQAQKGLIPGIERNDILDLLCPLPPLAEQYRIVDKIEEAFDCLDKVETLQSKYSLNLTALKSKLIDAAIQGKLTEQLPEDGSAEELYQQIQMEKQSLVKEGKIRKDKKYEEIKAENIPYQIPPYWKWVRFGKIINLQSGQDLKPEEYNANNTGIPYITGASNYTDNGSFIINRWTENPKAFAAAGDILLSCKGTVGKLSILQIPEVHIARQIMGIRTYCISNAFAFYFMQSVIYGIKQAQKGLIPGIERNDILDLLCPLPPLAEQKRIVEILDKVFALVGFTDEK